MLKRTVAVITRKGEVITRQEAIPELKENEVLIKVHISLISPGTEMNKPRDRRIKPDGNDEEWAIKQIEAWEREQKKEENGF